MYVSNKRNINCAICGVRTGLLTREKLMGGECLCVNCQHKLPALFFGDIKHLYIEKYKEILEYLDTESCELEKTFHKNISYSYLSLDTANGIIMYKHKNGPSLYLNIKNISSFNLNYILNEKGKGGKVNVLLEYTSPKISINTTLEEYEPIPNDVYEFMKCYNLAKQRFTYK